MNPIKKFFVLVLMSMGVLSSSFAKPLTVGISQEFESLNPTIMQMSASNYIYYLAGRPIVAIDDKWQWTCFLCIKIPTLENKLAKKIVEGGKEKIISQWEILPNAVWGDGTPITGNDIKFSWEVGKSPNVSVGGKEVYTDLEEIVVDAKNPKKFTIKFTRADYNFYQIGTFGVLPKHIEGPIWEKTKDQNGGYEKQSTYITNPTLPGLYFGPYVVKELKLGSHVILERNPKFYGTPAKIDQIIFKLIPNTQALEANLLSGTIDMIGQVGLDFDQALALEKRLKADPALAAKYAVQFREGMIYEHIDLNLRNPILADVNIRRALIYGIDRDKLVQALFEGRQHVAAHDIHPLDPYYTDDVWKYKADPVLAAQILDKAGWKVGADGIREKNGQKLSFSFMTTAGNKTRELVQVFLQNEWRKVGIDVKIKNEPARVFFGETVRKAAYPGMAMYAWTSSPDNPPRTTLHSDSIPTEANGFSGQNAVGFKDSEVDSALDKIRVEFSFNKRKELMKLVQREYTKELPVIPLYLRSEIAVLPTALKNHQLTGHQFMNTLVAERWELK